MLSSNSLVGIFVGTSISSLPYLHYGYYTSSIDANSANTELLQSWKKLLSPYGLHDFDKGGSGADISPLKGENVTLVGYRPDPQRYFDYHHTSRDTFDKVNKRELELGSASMASIIYLMDKYLYSDTPLKP